MMVMQMVVVVVLESDLLILKLDHYGLSYHDLLRIEAALARVGAVVLPRGWILGRLLLWSDCLAEGVMTEHRIFFHMAIDIGSLYLSLTLLENCASLDVAQVLIIVLGSNVALLINEKLCGRSRVSCFEGVSFSLFAGLHCFAPFSDPRRRILHVHFGTHFPKANEGVFNPG